MVDFEPFSKKLPKFKKKRKYICNDGSNKYNNGNIYSCIILGNILLVQRVQRGRRWFEQYYCSNHRPLLLVTHFMDMQSLFSPWEHHRTSSFTKSVLWPMAKFVFWACPLWHQQYSRNFYLIYFSLGKLALKWLAFSYLQHASIKKNGHFDFWVNSWTLQQTLGLR